jgi:CheY-like chemotaxis protein
MGTQQTAFEKVSAKENVKVLIVDDNAVNLAIAQGFLDSHNIKAVTALSGAQAIEMAKEKNYDLILMDIMMPEMDGYEAAKQIRALGSRAPIVALTANESAEMANKFTEYGMNDLLTKPINNKELNNVLKKWLPMEKITICETEVKADDLENDEVYQKLSLINWLDVKAGLENIGHNRSSYYAALRQFADNCGSYVEELNKTLKAETWNEYRIKIHALKGVLAAFGVQRLSLWAEKLEKNSKDAVSENSTPDLCIKETAPFCSNLLKFRDKLLEAQLPSAVETAEKTDKPKGDENLFKEKIKLLKTSCEQCSADEIDRILSELNKYEWKVQIKNDMEKILKLALNYDYEIAIEIIKQHI